MLERVLRAREARATMIAERIVDIYRRDRQGRIPALQAQPSFAGDEHWKDLLLFYEYFDADTGQGLGAAHQTGWTGLIANLVMGRYRKDIPRVLAQGDPEPGGRRVSSDPDARKDPATI